jgi:hypothetical protein
MLLFFEHGIEQSNRGRCRGWLDASIGLCEPSLRVARAA